MKITLPKLTMALALLFASSIGLIASCNDVNQGGENVIDSECCLVKKEKDSSALKDLKVNLFLETSGSMAGFMDINGTTFQKDIWAIVEGLDTKFIKTFNIFEVRSKSLPLNHMSAAAFRSNLNTGGFVSSSSTDIPEMLDSILNKTDKHSVSILVSDLIFSPDNGSQAQIMQITTDIKKRFSGKKLGSVLLQLNSEFYQKVKVDNSPYYVWIMGAAPAVKAVSEFLKSGLDNSPNEMDFGINHSVPAYSILPSESKVLNASPTVCTQDGNFYAYTEFDNSESDKITFWVGVNLSTLPSYIKTPAYLQSNLELDAGSAKARVLEVTTTANIRNADDLKLVKTSKLTHMIRIEISQVSENAVLKLNVKRQRPFWVNDLDLEVEDNFRKKTFGLKKMVVGLENAYDTKQDIFKCPIQIFITKNKS